MKSVLRAVKNHAYSYSDIEIKVREATSNAELPPPISLLREISRATHDTNDYPQLFSMLWQRLADVEQPRHVTKAIAVIEYLLLNGSERFVSDVRRRKKDLNALTQYKHYDEHNYDDAKDARMIAKRVSTLLNDTHLLAESRETNTRTKRSTPDQPKRTQRHVNNNELDNEYDDNDDDNVVETEYVNRNVVSRSRNSPRHIAPKSTHHPVASRERNVYHDNNANDDHDDLGVVSEEEMDEPHIVGAKTRTNTRTTVRQSHEIYEPEIVQSRHRRRSENVNQSQSKSLFEPDLMSEPYVQSVQSGRMSSNRLNQELDLLSLNDSQFTSPSQPTYIVNDPITLSSPTSAPPKHVPSNSVAQNRKAALLAELAALDQEEEADVANIPDVHVRPESTRSAARSKVSTTDPLWSNSLVSLSPASAGGRPIVVAGGATMAELRKSRPLPSSAVSSQLIEDFSHRTNARQPTSQRRTNNPNDIFFN